MISSLVDQPRRRSCRSQACRTTLEDLSFGYFRSMLRIALFRPFESWSGHNLTTKMGPSPSKYLIIKKDMSGGGRGIRTPERVTPLTVFKTAGFNHSPIPPTSFYRSRSCFIHLYNCQTDGRSHVTYI